MYMNDVKFFGRSKEDMDALVLPFKTITDDVRKAFSLSKCADVYPARQRSTYGGNQLEKGKTHQGDKRKWMQKPGYPTRRSNRAAQERAHQRSCSGA